MEKEYRVVWEVDVTADSELKAALQARLLQLGKTTATVYKVGKKEVDIGCLVNTNKMDVTAALFNCHINNAEERAKESYIAFFGKESFDANIQPYLDKGIMSILKTQPTPTLQFYVYTIWNFVNGF
jgi:hypothetical protein